MNQKIFSGAFALIVFIAALRVYIPSNELDQDETVPLQDL